MAIAKISEIIASSKISFDDAIKQGIRRADQTLKNIKSAWIKDQQVMIEKGEITAYRVTMVLTFVLAD